MFLQADTELHISCIIVEDFTKEYDNIDSPDCQLFMADIEDAVRTYHILTLDAVMALHLMPSGNTTWHVLYPKIPSNSFTI